MTQLHDLLFLDLIVHHISEMVRYILLVLPRIVLC